MRSLDIPPNAAALSQSLRDLGYSLETAIADIIDNSIAAGARNIDIWCDPNEADPSLAIIDDGSGMDQSELVDAMRFGSRNPRDDRTSGDLGRFGLGLKTASFSQCRKITVVSRRNEALSAAIWDLDVLAKDSWLLGLPGQDLIDKMPWFEKLPSSGTMVLWEKLDRLSERSAAQQQSEILAEKLSRLEHHLALVFHRFLPGDPDPVRNRKVAIRINGHPVKGFDPFCRSNRATQWLPEQSLSLEGHTIRIQPFILPHHSKLSKTEYDFYTSRSDFVSNQGAYVYRSGRLMAWGDWFRLVPKGEVTKLARVRIDFPTELDELWTIDIKKSRAHPPPEVREQLRQIIGRISERSARVYRGRSERLLERATFPLWARTIDNGRIIYSPASDHPLVTGFEQRIPEEFRDEFRSLLDVIGGSLPVEAIQADMSTSPKELERADADFDSEIARSKLRKLFQLSPPGISREVFRGIVDSTRLFEGRDSFVDEVIEEFISDA